MRKGRPGNKPAVIPLKHTIVYVKAKAPFTSVTALIRTTLINLTLSPATPRVARALKPLKRRQKTVPGPPKGNPPRLKAIIRRNLSQFEVQKSLLSQPVGFGARKLKKETTLEEARASSEAKRQMNDRTIERLNE